MIDWPWAKICIIIISQFAVLRSISVGPNQQDFVYLRAKYLYSDALIKCENIKNILYLYLLPNLRYTFNMYQLYVHIPDFGDTICDYITVTANKLQLCLKFNWLTGWYFCNIIWKNLQFLSINKAIRKK